jgi:hypothetical protein
LVFDWQRRVEVLQQQVQAQQAALLQAAQQQQQQPQQQQSGEPRTQSFVAGSRAPSMRSAVAAEGGRSGTGPQLLQGQPAGPEAERAADAGRLEDAVAQLEALAAANEALVSRGEQLLAERTALRQQVGWGIGGGGARGGCVLAGRRVCDKSSSDMSPTCFRHHSACSFVTQPVT